MGEKHTVFSIISDFSKEPMAYQSFTPPGEKCGLVIIQTLSSVQLSRFENLG